MARNVKKIAVISSHLPRKCGIATFASDLVHSMSHVAGTEFEPLGVAVHADDECKYLEPVKFEIRRNVKNDYFTAADFLTFSQVEAISLQHEFGLYGGSAGNYINLFLRKMNVPVITTLHTVLQEPTPPYFKSLAETCNLSSKVIVMNERGVCMLRDVYGVPEKKIELIPHGIPDVPFEESWNHKIRLGLHSRQVILTFGLLGRNKGIEVMIRALPDIVKAHPNVLYVVLGATHPEVLKSEGEAYRFSLYRLARELGVQDNVSFQNRFVSDIELRDYMLAADVYVTPYLSKEQLTSGTLARAVGSGKAVVSTPYWAAQELLADGRGKLVDFNSPQHLTEAINELLGNQELFNAIRRQAYDYGMSMTWPKVGASYWKLFQARPELVMSVSDVDADQQQSGQFGISDLPSLSLAHLLRLTDDTGLFQHAKYTLPNRQHGYCSDDNARAVLVMIKYYNQYAGRDALRLLNIYLSFICDAQDCDGPIHNFMTFNRSWFDTEPTHDALGRMLWAFGATMASAPSQPYLFLCKECFDRNLKRLGAESIRSNAYSILGMADYLQQFPGASEIKRELENSASRIMAAYDEHRSDEWRWLGNELTYDNAVLPQALFVGGKTLGDDHIIDAAIEISDFLIANTFNGTHFSFVGNHGWLRRGRNKAQFDQQPIEAASTVMMLKTAFDVTGQSNYLSLQKKAFDWFLGANDLSIPVYDFKTEGCCDALQANGVNINQGAESTICFLMSLLTMMETFAALGLENNKKRAEQKPIAAADGQQELQVPELADASNRQ